MIDRRSVPGLSQTVPDCYTWAGLYQVLVTIVYIYNIHYTYYIYNIYTFPVLCPRFWDILPRTKLLAS